MVVGAAGYSALGNNTPGAAYVYSRGADGTWARSFVRPSSTPLIDSSLVRAVAISADGTTLAVGTPFDASGARGINGDQNDTSAPGSGAVHVFR
jgi:hypothetical protein